MFPLMMPLINFILWMHMVVNPIKVVEIKTDGTASILQAITKSHRIETGLVCESMEDIKSIDGLAENPASNLYWTIEVNGDYEHYNSRSIVSPSDKIVLKYSHMRQECAS